MGKRFIPETYKKRAKELFFENRAGKHVYTISEIYDILREECPEVKIAKVSLYKLVQREGWKREYATRLKREQAKVLNEIYQISEWEDCSDDKAFDNAMEELLKKQITLAEELFHVWERMDIDHPSFCKMAEILNKVNLTTFRMLSELGYSHNPEINDTPLIVINEIDGTTRVLNGENLNDSET